MASMSTRNIINKDDIPHNTNNSIMIVDDSRFARNVLHDILTNHGYQVIAEAKNGLEAIELTKAKKPKIIFLDVEMPMMDGISVIPLILNIDPKIHIIMCTALGQKSIIVEAVKSGAKDYVIKPYKKENILRVLNQIMESNKAKEMIKPIASSSINVIEQQEFGKMKEGKSIVSDIFSEVVDQVAVTLDPLSDIDEINPALEISQYMIEDIHIDNALASTRALMEAIECDEQSAMNNEHFPSLEVETECNSNDPVTSTDDELLSDKADQEFVCLKDIAIKISVPRKEETISYQPSEDELIELYDNLYIPTASDNNGFIRGFHSIHELELSESDETEDQIELFEWTREPLLEEDNKELYELLERLEASTDNYDEYDDVSSQIIISNNDNADEAAVYMKEIEPLVTEGIIDADLHSNLSEINVKTKEYYEFAYLWDHRFGLRNETSLNNQSDKKLSFHRLVLMSNRNKYLPLAGDSSQEFKTGIIRAYLNLGNRFHQDDKNINISYQAKDPKIRISISTILEGSTDDNDDLAMSDILSDPCKKDQNKASLENDYLSKAIMQLVQDKQRLNLSKRADI